MKRHPRFPTGHVRKPEYRGLPLICIKTNYTMLAMGDPGSPTGTPCSTQPGDDVILFIYLPGMICIEIISACFYYLCAKGKNMKAMDEFNYSKPRFSLSE